MKSEAKDKMKNIKNVKHDFFKFPSRFYFPFNKYMGSFYT